MCTKWWNKCSGIRIFYKIAFYRVNPVKIHYRTELTNKYNVPIICTTYIRIYLNMTCVYTRQARSNTYYNNTLLQWIRDAYTTIRKYNTVDVRTRLKRPLEQVSSHPIVSFPPSFPPHVYYIHITCVYIYKYPHTLS
jgi:hypothetical protein